MCSARRSIEAHLGYLRLFTWRVVGNRSWLLPLHAGLTSARDREQRPTHSRAQLRPARAADTSGSGGARHLVLRREPPRRPEGTLRHESTFLPPPWSLLAAGPRRAPRPEPGGTFPGSSFAIGARLKLGVGEFVPSRHVGLLKMNCQHDGAGSSSPRRRRGCLKERNFARSPPSTRLRVLRCKPSEMACDMPYQLFAAPVSWVNRWSISSGGPLARAIASFRGSRRVTPARPLQRSSEHTRQSGAGRRR